MKVLVIVGPTGIGKTELSLEIAQKYNGEIISGDSIQIYKELNIGSAKVSQQERELVVHHLVDEYALWDNYDVSIFQKEARQKIAEITKRNKLPIIVGGTGLYISAVLKNYIFLPEDEDQVLSKELSALSNEALYAKLLELDKPSALALHPNNRQRLIRAITIAKSSRAKKSEIVEKQTERLLYDAHIISLEMERQLLYERINERVLEMQVAGLKAEVTEIVNKYENAFELRGMFGIGYKEWQAYFEGEKSEAEVIAEIQKRSRNYAKRQFTWFRNQFDAQWFNVLDVAFKERVFASIDKWLETGDSDV